MWYIFNAWKNKERDTCGRERERERAARWGCPLCFARASGSVEVGRMQPGLPPPSRGYKTLQKHWTSNLASVFWRGGRGGPESRAGARQCPWHLGGLPLCATPHWLPPRSHRSLALRLHVLHLLATVSGCQAGRASAAPCARRSTGVIYIASTWGPCAVASDFSRVLPGRKQEALCSRQWNLGS